jgi:predicted NACHT family NTPase
VQHAIGKMTRDNLAQKQKQQKQEEDYFSFFSSSERILMKPEASFQGIRHHMEQLPTDFCLLFQDGFDELETGSMFDKSTYVFAVGLPVL